MIFLKLKVVSNYQCVEYIPPSEISLYPWSRSEYFVTCEDHAEYCKYLLK
jgi:hypothetical protein